MSKILPAGPGPGARSGGRPRSRATDEAILRAALELFIEAGAEGASIEKIARRAGTTRAAVYRRHASKEDLLARAIGRVREQAEEQFGQWQQIELPELVALLTGKDAVRLMLREDYARLLARLVGSIPASPDLIAIYRKTYLEPRQRAFTAILRRARDQGRIPADSDVEMIADIISGTLLSRVLLQPLPAEAEMQAYVDRLVAQLGLGGRGAPS